MRAIVSGDIEWILESSTTDNAFNVRTVFTKFTHKVQNIAVADDTADVKAFEKLQASAILATLTTFPLLSVTYSLAIPQLCMDGWKVTFLHRTCILERA